MYPCAEICRSVRPRQLMPARIRAIRYPQGLDMSAALPAVRSNRFCEETPPRAFLVFDARVACCTYDCRFRLSWPHNRSLSFWLEEPALPARMIGFDCEARIGGICNRMYNTRLARRILEKIEEAFPRRIDLNGLQ